MAKKLIYDYTIDAASNKISVKGNHRIETLLIITDITAGKILYKFANADFGFSSSTFNTATGFTDIILVQDLDAIGVTNSDKLQVFFEDENIGYGDLLNALNISEIFGFKITSSI